MVVGTIVTPLVFNTKKVIMASLAVFLSLFNFWRLSIAFRPNGVAALPKPAIFAAMLLAIKPSDSSPSGTLGNIFFKIGVIILDIQEIIPASSAIFISPIQITRSGNDAAIALAYHVAGSMEGFAFLMNNKAKDLGMNNTNFVNSSGLEDGDNANISTVYDMALLSSYAINNSLYKKIVGTKDITVKTDLKTYVWHNKNKLLSSYKYCVGGKTGFTERARRTLVTNASKDGVNLTVVTFNDGNDFGDHKDLYEKYFGVLKKYELVSEGYLETKYDNSYVDKSFKMSLTKDEYKRIKKEISYYDNSASKVIGKISVSLDGKEYFSEDIYIKDKPQKEEVKLNFWQRLIKRLKELW